MPDILHRVGIDAEPHSVYGALTTIEGLRSWWQSCATGNPAKGGVINFGFCDMSVLAGEPDKFVHWRCVRGPDEWIDTEVTFQLYWKDSQTFVLFKHKNWKKPVEFMHQCSTKWAAFLFSLRDAVEHGTGRPEPNDFKIYVGD